jgi:indole-3-glycerol phosphate synthase
MADVLEEIVQRTRARLEAQKQRLPLGELRKQAAQRKKIFPFAQALKKQDGIAVIAELKQASPSAGVIREESDLAGRVKGYARGGAVALSILTEEYYFHGSPYILELARKECDLPILRKDFIVDPYQIEESRHMGADAILLISTLLSLEQMRDLLSQTWASGMDALVETHNAEDIDKALRAGANLIGINHRNLRTLQMDLTTAERLLPLIPKEGKTVVVESGIKTPEEAARFYKMGAEAVLIGETLMRHPNAEEIVRSFAQAGRDSKRKPA